MMKQVRFLGLVAAMLALSFAASTFKAAAAGPTNTDPAHALAITTQSITIPANSALWFSFGYAGDRSLIMISLANGSNGRLAFDLWTPEQAAALTDEKPIGRGTVQNINCDSGVLQRSGDCQSDYLFWQGNFNAEGTYYVEAFNNQSSPVTTELMVNGTGVTLGSAPSTATSQPSNQRGAAAPAASTGPASNLDLQHAASINNQPITIPANTTLWYKFAYAGSTPGNRAPITITLWNGNSGHLAFDLWTPEQAADMTGEKTIGRGTVQNINCDTGIPRRNGDCQSDYLFWQGSFYTAGTYYAEVFNNNSNPVTAQLVVQGSGITLGQ